MARAIEKHGGEVVGPYPDIEPAFLALGKAAAIAAWKARDSLVGDFTL
ncbi:hypothetical protein [Rhizobium phaseoli]|nr:hypothetical protein [Rhizobium phaseoli]